MTTSTIKKKRKGKTMENKLTRLALNANTQPEIVAQTDRTLSDEQLQAAAEEYRVILRQARRGLTDDSLEAVMVLKRELEYRQLMVDLLLEGEVEAEIYNYQKDILTSDHFRFRLAPDAELGKIASEEGVAA